VPCLAASGGGEHLIEDREGQAGDGPKAGVIRDEERATVKESGGSVDGIL
jgi:hypothetical protein